MKKYFTLLLILLLVGCSTKVETEKTNYLEIKNRLEKSKNFITEEQLVCDVKISVDKINDEEISYRVIVDNPKINMHKVKALVIHDYFTEDIFPSIGIFEKGQDLLMNSETVKGFSLVGYIDTTKKIKDLDLDIRLWIEYTDDLNKKHEIYYDSTEY